MISTYLVDMGDGSYRFLPHGTEMKQFQAPYNWKRYFITSHGRSFGNRIKARVKTAKEYGDPPFWCREYR